MAIINKSTKTSGGKDVEKREPQCTVGGNADWCSHCGKQYGISSQNCKWNCLLTQRFHCWDYTLRITNSKETSALHCSLQPIFTIAKCWKQPKCPSVSEWIKKLWYIYTMEFYAAERKKELLPFATAWMKLESIMLSEIRQEVRDKYHMISPLTGT